MIKKIVRERYLRQLDMLTESVSSFGKMVERIADHCCYVCESGVYRYSLTSVDVQV